MAEAMSAPFIDFHVLRDDTVELTLYGDDDAAIPNPDRDAILDALARVEDAVLECRDGLR
jgi:hypothetical protein